MVVVEELEAPLHVARGSAAPASVARAGHGSERHICRDWEAAGEAEHQGSSPSPVSSDRTRSRSPSCSRTASASPRSRTSLVPATISSAATTSRSGAELHTAGNCADEKGIPMAPRHDVDLLRRAMERLDAVTADVTQLRRAQEQLGKKHEDAEVFRRGQIDSVSDRVFQVERMARKTEQEQSDAIEKASLTFQKTFAEVQKDRHNMMSTITQVNQNFERVSIDIGEQRTSLVLLQQGTAQMKQGFDWLSNDAQHKSNAFRGMQQSMASLEQTLQAQSHQIQELQVATQALRELRVSSFADAEERQRKLVDSFAEVHSQVASLAAQVAKVDAELCSAAVPPCVTPREVPVQIIQGRMAAARGDIHQAAPDANERSPHESGSPDSTGTQPPWGAVGPVEGAVGPCISQGCTGPSIYDAPAKSLSATAHMFPAPPARSCTVPMPAPPQWHAAGIPVDVEAPSIGPPLHLSASASLAADLSATAPARPLARQSPFAQDPATPCRTDSGAAGTGPLRGGSLHMGMPKMSSTGAACDDGRASPMPCSRSVQSTGSHTMPVRGMALSSSQTHGARPSTPVPGRPTAAAAAPSTPQRRLSGRHGLSASFRMNDGPHASGAEPVAATWRGTPMGSPWQETRAPGPCRMASCPTSMQHTSGYGSSYSGAAAPDRSQWQPTVQPPALPHGGSFHLQPPSQVHAATGPVLAAFAPTPPSPHHGGCSTPLQSPAPVAPRARSGLLFPRAPEPHA